MFTQCPSNLSILFFKLIKTSIDQFNTSMKLYFLINKQPSKSMKKTNKYIENIKPLYLKFEK